MVPKKVEWSVFAQCDLFAVQRLVETPDRPAMKTIEPMLETIFERKLKKEAKWKNTYDAITKNSLPILKSSMIVLVVIGSYTKGKLF